MKLWFCIKLLIKCHEVIINITFKERHCLLKKIGKNKCTRVHRFTDI